MPRRSARRTKSSATAPRSQWSPRPVLLALAAILLFALFSGEIRDTDIWLHLKTGERTLQTRALTAPDSFSYTSAMGTAAYPREEVTRYFNLTHEWLAQIVVYLIYRATGFPGLVLVRAALLILFCALIGWMAYRRTNGFYIGVAATLAAAGVAFHFQQSRPFLVTFVLLALTMAILESGQRLWLLPPVFLIWANCHAGFIMGWLVLGAYCGEALIRHAPDRHRLWIAAAACLLISGLNPNGFRVIQILLLYRASGIQSNNLEWQRPKFWEPGMYSFLLLASLITLVLARRRARPVDWLLYFGFAAISLLAVRNVIFMGLIGPILIASYAPESFRKSRALPAACALLAAILLAYDVAPAMAAGNVFALRAAQWQLPAVAADFIQMHRITDRMFNNYETGGYLVWRLWPLQRDFIDPRGLSEQAYADYRRILFNTDSAKFLDKYGIQMVVTEGFDYLSGQVYPLVVELAQNPGWKLVYWDAQGVIFMRHPPPGVEPADPVPALLESLDAQCEEHIHHDQRRPNCARGLSEVYAFQGKPDQALRWIAYYRDHRTEPDPESDRMYQSLRVTELNNRALALEERGNLAGAEALFRSALEVADKTLGPDHSDTAGSLNNLAGLLEAKEDYAGAEALYRRALVIAEKTLGPSDPRTAMALDNLAGALASEGDVAHAETLYRRALAIAEKALGPDHDTTRTIRQDFDALTGSQSPR